MESILPSSRFARLTLAGLFIAHCSLRFAGLSWNTDRFSAWATTGIPSYHIDEILILDSLKKEFGPYSSWSVLSDGPASVNMIWAVTKLAGRGASDSHFALLAGRAIAAASDSATFVVLWLLLRALGVSTGIAVFGLCCFTLAPNQILNSHFARSHTLAGTLQLLSVLTSVRAVGSPSLRRAACWLGLSVCVSIFAGAVRYPFLTLLVFPMTSSALLLRGSAAGRSRVLAVVFIAWVIGSVAAIGLGFDMRPVEILRAAWTSQLAVKQIEWFRVGALLLSAMRKALETVWFRGGLVLGVLAVSTISGLLSLRHATRQRRWLVWAIAAWGLGYLFMWARYDLAWQRYSMPFGMTILVLGVIGLEDLRTRAPRLISPLVGAVLLMPSVVMGLTIADRFVDDANAPLYLSSQALHAHPPPSGRVLISDGWVWNHLVYGQLLPPIVRVQYVASEQALCETLAPGDIVIDFVFKRLMTDCDGKLTRFAEYSNLGVLGWPYQAEERIAGSDLPYEDYHYLFQEVLVREATRDASKAHLN